MKIGVGTCVVAMTLAGCGTRIVSGWSSKTVMPSGATDVTYSAVWGTGSNDVWAVGTSLDSSGSNSALIVHWDGKDWSFVPSGSTGGLTGVWASGPDNAWAVGGGANTGQGNGFTLHWDGTAWSRIVTGSQCLLFAVWGTSADNVWMVGNSASIDFNGTTWAPETIANPTFACSGPAGGVSGGDAFGAISGTSATDVWAVGWSQVRDEVGGALVHWDGTSWGPSQWTDAPLDISTISSVWAISPTDAWAVGASPVTGGGGVIHWNGSLWSSDVSGAIATTDGQSNTYNGVWASASNDAWMVGVMNSNPSGNAQDTGLAFHWDGTTWTSVSTGTGNTLHAAWGSSSSDVWAVGDHGTILHYPP